MTERITRHVSTAQFDVIGWHAAEVTPAGTWVATRVGPGFFTGILGILGSDLILRGRGLPGLTRHGPEQSLAALAQKGPKGAIHGLDGLGGYVLLDALAALDRIDLLEQQRKVALECIASIADIPLGLSGMAGTLLLLDAALGIRADNSTASAINTLLDCPIVDRTLTKIADASSRCGPMTVTNTTHWTLLLAASRASHSAGNARIRQICSDILAHDLSAPDLDARLFRLLLWTSPASEIPSHRVLTETLDVLSHLSNGNPASQYGLGAVIGILVRANHRHVIPEETWRHARDVYARRIECVMSSTSSSVHGGAALYDMARGMAGFALRMSDLHDKQSTPSTVLF